jgi:hypothetical protein
MTSLPIPIAGSEFNDFLFAPIGEDRNGMLVSVRSGLARSDVDPWQEAAKLAQLSGEAATKEYRQQIKDSPPHDASATVDRACEKMFHSCHDRLRSGYEKLCRQETT